MVDFAHHARTRVILFDGGMGTQIQSRDLTVEEDFWGQENCSEILNLSRPDLVTEIHRGYLLAGADANDAVEGESAEADTAAAVNTDAAEDGGEAESGDGKPAVVVNEDRLGGVWYWIRWGDTLWDISYSFYRTLWLYSKIAGANNITNPDLIYANTRLFIPEN